MWTMTPKKWYVGGFPSWLGTQAHFYSRSFEVCQKPKPQWINNGTNERRFPAWDVKKVRPKSEVIRQAKMDGKTVHFANLVELCHLKNAELAKTPPETDGGELCCGRTTSKTKKDTGQYFALQLLRWQRQGSWTPSQSFLYGTQVEMTEAPRLLRLPKEECPEIWIRIPPRQGPNSWDNIEDPVVLLKGIQTVHPLASLL